MSAKFLHAFADENPDLSRQIGCMTGIFQMFDRQYLITNGRRLPAPPKRGPTLSNSSSVSADRISSSPQIILEKNLSKSWKETQIRVSLESSNSFSSSSSSFSSLDCNRSTNHDLPPVDRILFPEMPLKNSPNLKISDSDIRDVVKDSINRTKEGKEYQFYSKQGSVNEIDEPFRVLSKLKEVSRGSIMESNQTPRLSFDSRDPFSRSLTSRDGPRFSYDGRELSSSKSRNNNNNYNNYNNNIDNNNSNNNSRLSLDSKDVSPWDSDLDSSSSLNLNLNSNSGTKNGEKIGIVAKLMGLDTMPKSEINLMESNKDNKLSKEKIFINEKIVVPKTIKRQKNNKRVKNPDLGMKPMSGSRIPIEPAPWKTQERNSRISESRKPNSRVSVNKTEHVSVYSEIEKRLKDLEFEQSNRDLRALKQILDSMQAKGLLEIKKEETNSNPNPNFSQMKQNFRKNGTKTDFKSPIVIMKPAKSATGTVETVPVPDLPQVRTNDAIITKKPPINTKKPPVNTSPRVSPNKRIQKSTSNSNSNSNSNTTSSPRLQQKSQEIRSRPPIPNSNSDSNKTQRNKNSLDSISPRNRVRRKATQTERNDEVASDVSTGLNGDEVLLRSDSNISMMSAKVDVEVTSVDKSRNKKEKVQLDYSNVEINRSDPLPVTPEQPSPVSVLDNSFYHDDVSPPKTKSSNLLKDEKCQVSEKTSPKSKKMENIETLLQKLNQLSLSTETDKPGPIITDHISLFCETENPDDRYISEILLASGLLMKDSLEIQLHASGNPINPDLFLVLEQRKSGWVSKLGLKSDPIRMERKLVFDLVNEILLKKMDFKKGLSGQKLLREICAEIKELKREKERSENVESEVLCAKDLEKRSDEWARFERERSGLVLDIERGLFKELIDEVINGERVYVGFKNNNNNNNVKGKGRRRQLFVK